MNFLKSSIFLAVCIVSCLSQPTNKKASLPVLKDQPAEVLYRTDNNSTIFLECTTLNKEKDVEYSWYHFGSLIKPSISIRQLQGEGSIVMSNLHFYDEGFYQCFAKTAYGTASTRPISVKRVYLVAPKVETKIHKPVFGKPYKLECPLPDAHPKPTVTWKTQLLSDPKVVKEISDRRITVSPDGTLWFSNITESDVSPTFKYICLAITPAVTGDLILAEHVMQELVHSEGANDGKLVPQYISNDMVGQVGNKTMIYCIYGGTPLGFTKWYKNGVLINAKATDRVTDHNRTSGKRLLIWDTQLEDAGTYTCEVDNGVGKKQTHSMKLTIISAPIFVENLEKQLDIVKGKDVKIPCKVTGVPEPKVSWTYNGKPLENANYMNGTLTLSAVKQSDTGYYGCLAKNEYGVNYAETLVNVA